MSETKKVLVLRTCNAAMQGHGGFQWPLKGRDTPECGFGLHGLLWGHGDWGLLSRDAEAKWLVVEVDAETIIDLDGKVKFPRGNVVYAGGMAEAVCRTIINAPWIDEAVKATEGELVSKEPHSHLAASGHASKLAASGNDSKLAASGEGSVIASAGLNARAKAGEGGAIALAYWDSKSKRVRFAVGYVGEDGIKADTWYVVKDGKLTRINM